MQDASATASSFLIILVGVLGLLLVVVFLLVAISRTLLRMERQGGAREPQVVQKMDSTELRSSSPTPAMMKTMSGESVFFAFLAEDSSRKTLPKREQFAAYREWRQKNGLNWPHDPSASES